MSWHDDALDASDRLAHHPSDHLIDNVDPDKCPFCRLEKLEAMQARQRRRPRKRPREPMTTESLEKFADEYRNARAKAANDHTPWDAEAFAASIGYSLRQFYNRKKAAKERKILKEGE